MSFGIMLDVGLGLAFIFVLLSTIASAIQEIIASVLSVRGKVLRDMLRQILDQRTTAAPAAAPADPTSLGERVIGHPLITGLATPNLPGWLSRWSSSVKLPSYLPAGNFSTALVETLRHGHDETLAVASQVERAISMLPEGSPVQRTLQAFIVESKGDLDTFRARVQTWYDDAMDRAGGVYKRFSQYMLLAIGLLLAVALNIDVLQAADTLWHDKGARDAVTAAATSYVDSQSKSAPVNGAAGAPPPAGDANAQLIKQSIKVAKDTGTILATLPLPMGWHDIVDATDWDKFTWYQCVGAWLRQLTPAKILGFILTAFAVSLGAPFWFDMLQNVANLRGAGPPPARGQSPTDGSNPS